MTKPSPFPTPTGVILVKRGSDSPLDTPIIPCERCRAWVPHAPELLGATMQYSASAFTCTACGTRRRFG